MKRRTAGYEHYFFRGFRREANSIFGKSQEPIKALIESGVEAFQEFSAVDKIFSMDTTKNYAEKYTSETSMGRLCRRGRERPNPKTSIQGLFQGGGAHHLEVQL